MSLIFMNACSDSSTGSEPDPKGGEEPVEATASINNPSEGSVLTGVATFSVQGEAGNGFDELRIFLDEKLIETVDEPTLPHEYTFASYTYDNGEYNLKAELDVAGQDSTISVDVSVTLENYMVEMETDGYFEMLKNISQAAYIYIADPQGNVLTTIDVADHTDGVLKLLPPEELENAAPDKYSVTLGRVTTDYQGRDAFYLSTDVGLEPWKRIYKSGRTNIDPGPKRELTVEMTNFDQPPSYTVFQTTEYIDSDNIYYWDSYFEHPDPNTLTATFEVAQSSDDMVVTHIPDTWYATNRAPVYRWEKDLSSLPGTISYDVSQDFTPMVPHGISVPQSVELGAYAYFMTIAPNSFDKGDVDFAYWTVGSIGDADSTNAGFDLWVPQITERSFITYFDGYDKSDNSIRYRHSTPVIAGFPDRFNVIPGDVDMINPSMDDLQLEIAGSGFDNVRVIAEASSDTYYHRWSVATDQPDFVFPKIAGVLEPSVTSYNRSNFQFTTLIMTDTKKVNGYSEYLDAEYGNTDYGIQIGWTQTIKSLSSPQKMKPGYAVKPKGLVDPLSY